MRQADDTQAGPPDRPWVIRTYSADFNRTHRVEARCTCGAIGEAFIPRNAIERHPLGGSHTELVIEALAAVGFLIYVDTDGAVRLVECGPCRLSRLSGIEHRVLDLCGLPVGSPVEEVHVQLVGLSMHRDAMKRIAVLVGVEPESPGWAMRTFANVRALAHIKRETSVPARPLPDPNLDCSGFWLSPEPMPIERPRFMFTTPRGLDSMQVEIVPAPGPDDDAVNAAIDHAEAGVVAGVEDGKIMVEALTGGAHAAVDGEDPAMQADPAALAEFLQGVFTPRRKPKPRGGFRLTVEDLTAQVAELADDDQSSGARYLREQLALAEAREE